MECLIRVNDLELVPHPYPCCLCPHLCLWFIFVYGDSIPDSCSWNSHGCSFSQSSCYSFSSHLGESEVYQTTIKYLLNPQITKHSSSPNHHFLTTPTVVSCVRRCHGVPPYELFSIPGMPHGCRQILAAHSWDFHWTSTDINRYNPEPLLRISMGLNSTMGELTPLPHHSITFQISYHIPMMDRPSPIAPWSPYQILDLAWKKCCTSWDHWFIMVYPLIIQFFRLCLIMTWRVTNWWCGCRNHPDVTHDMGLVQTYGDDWGDHRFSCLSWRFILIWLVGQYTHPVLKNTVLVNWDD